MPETFKDANQRMADEFSRGAPARGIASVAGSIRPAAGTIGGRGNWTAGAAKTNSDAALRAGRRTADARSAGGPVGEEGPSAGSVNAQAVQKPFDSSVPEELRIAPLEPLSFSIPRYSNIDAPFDELLTPSSGGGAGAGDNAFTISDATDGSTELILVSPGLLEIINGGFSTFIVPTLGGDPITDQTPIAAVSGPVYLTVTLGAAGGAPVSAAVENAASLPADTATEKHTQIGTITVGTSVVTVDTQDVTSNVLYHVPSASPWSFAQTGASEVAVVGQAILTENLLTGDTITVTGLTGLTLGVDTTYWLVGTFNSVGGYTGWAVSATGPSTDRITWGASPTFYQNGAWYPLARVVSGFHPELPGFDFVLGGDPYHLEQLCDARLFMARGALNGRLVWYPNPL